MERLFVSRRNALILGAGSLIGSAAGLPRALAQNDVTDKDIFQFALNLEYMEAEYYLRATTGKGIDAEEAGSKAGEVTGGRAVKFKNDAIRQFGEELARNELAHVRFYRKTLGEAAVSRPAIDFDTGFKMAPKRPGSVKASTPSKTT